MRPVSVLLTGATGFVGQAVLRRLLHERADGREISVHAVVRTVPSATEGRAGAERSGVEWVRADLSHPASLRGVACDVDVLVHLACRVSGSDEECVKTNVNGTRAIIDEARRAGVGRIVQLSTAAVYGPGPHRGISVGGVTPTPVSAASRTRLAAERIALDAGAVVLRPGLILGAGDRWVIPALRELLERVPARWADGQGQVSAVDVGDLARLIGTLACARDTVPPGVYHACHPVPLRNRELMEKLTELGVLPPVTRSWSWEQCLRRLREVPGRMSERQFSLLALDHWYESEEIWRLSGCAPGPGPLARLAGAAPWYRAQLAESAAR